MPRPKRYPKGTWMKLQSSEILIAFMNRKGMSVTQLSRYAGCSRAMIGHLRTGYKKSCSPTLAENIAEALDIPLEALFVVNAPTVSARSAAREKVPA